MTPFFLYKMESLKPEEQIENMVQPLLEGSDMFVTSIKIKPTNNIKVFLDADSGLNISKCATVNRGLYQALEESGLFPDGNFSLEVSSPGVDEPLVSERQYKKNIGRTVEVTTIEGAAIIGELTAIDNGLISVHTKGTKKEAPKDLEIPLENIKTTVVQIVF